MKISIDENSEFLLEKVYSGIGLKSDSGETFNICMRDSGFEFNYMGNWYSAQNGEIKLLRKESK